MPGSLDNTQYTSLGNTSRQPSVFIMDAFVIYNAVYKFSTSSRHSTTTASSIFIGQQIWRITPYHMHRESNYV